jgi:hypothetical protein
VGIVACLASPGTLAAFPAVSDAHACRVAPDELWLVAPPARVPEIERFAAQHLAGAEPTALVLDESDGWTGFTLGGDEGPRVFAQLSAVPLPETRPAFVQGAVAGGPAKVLLLQGGIHVLVPSTLRHHVAARLRDVCGSRAVVPSEAVPFGDAGWAAAVPPPRASTLSVP